MSPFTSKNFVFLSFCIVFSFFSLVSVVKAQNDKPLFFFIRDLKEGMTGDDVKELQKMLNKDPETRISGTGIGSEGQESTYFGKITKEAVVRFQNKYHEDVLRPVGLSQGTGNVGLWTRLKLNQILISAQVTHTPPAPEKNVKKGPETIVSPESETVSSNPLVNLSSKKTTSKDLGLSSLSRYTAPAGTTVILSGTGFSGDKNIVKFGSTKSQNLNSGNNQISFTIPNDSKPGRYDISVIVSGKTSNTMPFMVTTPGAVPPLITKIEPTSVKFGEDIKIFGENFTKTENIVSTAFGIIQNVKSSDTKTLIFSLPLPDYLEDAPEGEFEWPVRPYVVNTNGMSKVNSAAKFIISK